MEALGALRRSAKTRKLSSSQTDALLISVGLRINLLMRGPAGTGKRWILRHAAHTLGQLGEGVELLAKFFNVLPNGQLVLDAAALPVAWSQLRRASVLVIDDVPSQSTAATAFFAYLDLLCRVARCATAPITAPSAAAAVNSSSGPTDVSGRWRVSAAAEEAPEQLPFGGLQILATQNANNADPRTETQPELVWSSSAASHPPHAATATPLDATLPAEPSSPLAPRARLGLVIGSALTSPHDTIKVVVFQ